MDPGKILDTISEYSDYYDEKKVVDSISTPLSLLPEDVLHVIPSFAMGSDGEYISELFLFTRNILCEVSLIKGDEYEYDFVNTKTIVNIRYERRDESFQGSGEPVNYKYIMIKTLHDFAGIDFGNELIYIGDYPDKWLEKVKDALPVSLLI